jgi:mRNA-degrading endonuclease toxin of MazEF toxin-antitoxin module
MDRGDVVRVELPRPQGQQGHEQFGLRPAVIIQEITNLSTVVIVPFTSSMKAALLGWTVQVSPSSENGLDVPSFALCSQIRAIDRKRIRSVSGRLSDDDMARIEIAIKNCLGFLRVPLH